MLPTRHLNQFQRQFDARAITNPHTKRPTVPGGPNPIKADKIQLVINDPLTEIELVAKPLEGESEGMSSHFVGTHDTVGIVKEFAGTISGQIEGTPYTGDFKEEPHGADQVDLTK